MIGGTVIETIVLPDRVWINCQERQTTHALWTPSATIREVRRSGHWGKANRDYDIKLERIGHSGVQRPS